MRKEFGVGYSLRRNDLSSMISRSAQDLQKLMMTFPTGWVRLPDNRDEKEQEWTNDVFTLPSRTGLNPHLFPQRYDDKTQPFVTVFIILSL